eukprot:CAMPEP_0174327146 /NCGR_PEP_ID=MMETSP0810-20121108/14347_1 /TAXON_ID=73025 ORGANISM="Eutreptiella gymnastica-like, Strain CCMP1594" /NCGR_SAMPLE_ID=MMETSP0810 /ASSEMBLY_ACC=CAM_ASM_000659 /LENGTH=134 /DNA_ID=CAMNT_0015440945 /DNA_START=75 /DNA_END=480 /DNA_ORIENTATION=+
MSELADVSGKSDPSRHRMNCAQNWRTEFVAQKPPPRGITDFHMARGWFLAELSACRAPGASRGQRQQKRSPQMVNSGANNGKRLERRRGSGFQRLERHGFVQKERLWHSSVYPDAAGARAEVKTAATELRKARG